MTISIIIPVYNEEKTISEVLTKLLNIRLKVSKEIILVDDGSSDDTSNRVELVTKKLGRDFIKVITHEKNHGKGAAIRSGIKVATGDYILIQDADLEYNPEEITNLIEATDKDTLQAVYGSRFMSKNVRIPKLYYLGNMMMTKIMNILYRVRLTDMETGYKLIPAQFLKNQKIRSSHFNLEPEITAKLIKSKISIKEVSISYNGRSRLAGKKLTPLDAFEAIYAIVYYRFFN